jgi:hypothetical protein
MMVQLDEQRRGRTRRDLVEVRLVTGLEIGDYL